MGYEIKMIFGRAGTPSEEFERDLERPYEDGSGFEYKKDARGNPVKTGRTEIWFNRYGQLDLCKLGSQDDSLNRLIRESFKRAKQNDATVYFFYEGNKQVKEDCYGAKMWPISAKEVLEAVNLLPPESMEYRRLQWAKALLESITKDFEDIQCLFYGH